MINSYLHPLAAGRFTRSDAVGYDLRFRGLSVRTSLALGHSLHQVRSWHIPLSYSSLSFLCWNDWSQYLDFPISARLGQKLSLTKPGCGWKEWADEAVKRRLMQYSHSQDGDIMVHFVSGSQSLWSRLRGLSGAEVELSAQRGEILWAIIVTSSKSALLN